MTWARLNTMSILMLAPVHQGRIFMFPEASRRHSAPAVERTDAGPSAISSHQAGLGGDAEGKSGGGQCLSFSQELSSPTLLFSADTRPMLAPESWLIFSVNILDFSVFLLLVDSLEITKSFLPDQHFHDAFFPCDSRSVYIYSLTIRSYE